MLFQRESGILLHLTSLPGGYGIGEIGAEAHRWLDALAEMGQGLWQMLPFGPTGATNSPYQSLSSFAADPMLLSLEQLSEDGLLALSDLRGFPSLPPDRVDYDAVIAARRPLLRQAAAAFRGNASTGLRAGFDAFRVAHAAWLDDYALFVALKDAYGGRAWTRWPRALRDREPNALAEARRRHADLIEQIEVLQFLFAHQWTQLRQVAVQRGIRLIGDVPIFVAHDSADVWANRELFHLDEAGRPIVVAGVPPDYFSKTGQRWGNPLYRWDLHRAQGYAWWTARIGRALDWVDVLRIDHFRGFAAYWEIPARQRTAVQGRWVEGPKDALFEAARQHFGALPIIAEDLGYITPDVIDLRDRLGFPGLRVFQFGFGPDPDSEYFLPQCYIENCVAYTGTHDNDTIVGWFHSTAHTDSTRTATDIAREREQVLALLGTDGSEINWDCIKLLLESRASAVLFPLQDVLGLGSEARMNTPGRRHGNWRWRFRWEQLTPAIRQRLRDQTTAAGRGTVGSGQQAVGNSQ